MVPAADGDALLAVALRDGVGELSAALRLTGSARRVVEARAQGASEEDVIALLADAGAPSRAAAAADAARFLAELEEHGLRGCGDFACGPDLPGVARAVLAGGHRLRFRARGRSMRPQVADGALLEVEARPHASVARGEVVLYSTPERPLVAHRVVGRRGDALLTRGDSAPRIDAVAAAQYLGVVARVQGSDGVWRPVSSGWRRPTGLVTGLLYRAAAGTARALVLRPLSCTFPGRSRVRAVLRFPLWLTGAGLRRAQSLCGRCLDRVDVLRAALLSSEEKDADRARLYARRGVQDFTSLDENLSAGLTLIEEVALARHDLAPGRALVLGCGPGRECFALAERGFEVTGLDREPGLLERARSEAAERGLDLGLVEGEAHDFHVDGAPFDLVVVFSGLYNMLLPRARRLGLLTCAREHLRPGGRVLLTFLSAYVPAGSGAPAGGRTFLEALNPEHERGDRFLLNESVHVFPSGADVAAEAEAAGLEVEALHRDQRAYSRAEGRVRGYALLRRAR